MDEVHSLSEEGVREGQGGGMDLQNNVDLPRPSCSDENENQLTEKGEEEADAESQGSWHRSRRDSMNNNGEDEAEPGETDNEEEDVEPGENNGEDEEAEPEEDKNEDDDDDEALRDNNENEELEHGDDGQAEPREMNGKSSTSVALWKLTPTAEPSSDRENTDYITQSFPTSSPAPSSPSLPLPPSSHSVQELMDFTDHILLPERLHQIAEAYYHEENYELALQLLSLEKLYHQQVLANLAGLQEQWESQCKESGAARGCFTETTRAEVGPEQLEVLTRICRTHQRSSSQTTAWDTTAKHILPSGSLRHKDSHTTALRLCGTENKVEVLLGMEEASPLQEPDSSALIHQGASGTSDLLHTTPSLAVPASRGEDTHCHARLVGASPAPTEEKVGGMDSTAGTVELLRDIGRTETGPTGDTLLLLDSDRRESNLGEEEQEKPEIVEVEVVEESTEYEAEEDGFAPEVAEAFGITQASLDDLAKRIQVEEISPASGLVSILKRREGEGEPAQAPVIVKQAPKRKVRFREPEEGLDHDEVGGDSWLLLFILCMATVVISVGGTALYCTLGDPQSSICTEFSHNMDLYFTQVQRGLEDLCHWLSPAS